MLKSLEEFLESKENKPALVSLFGKLLEDKFVEYMRLSFIEMLDYFVLKSESPYIQRLGGEYSVEFLEEDTQHKLKIRRNKSTIEVTIGANYYRKEEK